MMEIIPMLPEHAADVLRIYGEGLKTGMSTFNTEVPSWEDWDRNHLPHTRLVAVEMNEVLGWVALLPVSARACYRGVAEFSIYIATRHRGRGIADLLMQALVQESEANGIWTLQSSTFADNKTSLRLQERHGFRQIGYRDRVAQLHGVWRNTILLERRSDKF
ncbi:N-acetyltransferase family protein [Pontibacter sp. JH31]|uniref:N-acetyltransferase family protein n=1 Tax=Pontibacter aquaedesilientis TaxID=2766980 RepID=A0ABR7XBG0_9BACT|nr:GNAT family N-acetyltransferase [Pontibacter aquaedesilientis]MBD1395649.1 N-acetyltransferase family protein [Pontibacter aquaedesilientis]